MWKRTIRIISGFVWGVWLLLAAGIPVSAQEEVDSYRLRVHYYRYDEDYQNLSLLVGPKLETEVPFVEMQGSAEVEVELTDVSSEDRVPFQVLRSGEVADHKDSWFKTADANDKGVIDIYLRQGSPVVALAKQDTSHSFGDVVLESLTGVYVKVKIPIRTEDADFILYNGEEKVSIGAVEALNEGGKDSLYGTLENGYASEFMITCLEPVKLGQEILIEKKGWEPCAVTMGSIYDSPEFNRDYVYDGDDLGASYTKEQTCFKLWAPTAASAQVLLYETGDGNEEPAAHDMSRGEKGIWFLEIQGDLNGLYYTYKVTREEKEYEAIDPYAKACGVNGIRGQIIYMEGTDPEGFQEDAYRFIGSPVDAIIYELHVRDLSTYEDSGIQDKGKFGGLTEAGTTTSDGTKTGLDHIKELGITHIQLLPVFDQKSVNEKNSGNSFNWGYDPMNYNIPEGSYASDAYDGSVRVKEMKEMVLGLHKEGIGVVMDVVYNHTADNFESNFHKLMPGYYHRMSPQGGFLNGSACENETASERAMMRKFIINSVTYWAKEYHIDGFRFDLMGLHDMETMNEIRKALDEIDPDILMYGEGWDAGSAGIPESMQSVKRNTYQMDARIGAFSDDIRDGIKGSVFEAAQPGYINGNPKRTMDIRFGIAGAVNHPGVNISKVSASNNFWAAHPTQTVNYVSCHDNYTLWDKLTASKPDADEQELMAMNRLSAAIVLTSQGIPFFQAGEEIGRSKNGDHNSYKSSDLINQINWSEKAERIDLFRYYQGLIELRKECPLFRLKTGDEVRENLSFIEDVPDRVVAYTLSDSDNKFLVIFNGDEQKYELSLPDRGWDVLVDGKNAGIMTLYSVGDRLTVESGSAYVLLYTGKVGLGIEKIMALLFGASAALAAGIVYIRRWRKGREKKRL
ncbi:pullulanase [Kineothrix alysoides]|uniref:Pullulanase n=1 Tax=Kineothrix alysoides TaxID=1469948 RepID=A0A4R1R6G7_9FIRM|nr:type I pullulanase [Kineothrix alysoides]TCL61164.1 pullulanase [Kineothrix alysoides]